MGGQRPKTGSVEGDEPWLIVRAEAGPRIGIGHLMRCAALAQAWRDTGGRAVFASAGITSALDDLAAAEGWEVRTISASPGGDDDVRDTARIARSVNASWIVADGDDFGTDYQRSIKAEGFRLLAIEDGVKEGRYRADLVVNQNYGAAEAMYEDREEHSRLLLGTRYALLRRAFRVSERVERPVRTDGRHVLVTFGGGALTDSALVALEAVASAPLDGLEVVFVAGSTELATEARVEELRRRGRPVRYVGATKNIEELMRWADVAVIAAGGTLWESMCAGCAVVSFARNALQRRILGRLADDGVIRYVGDLDDVAPVDLTSEVVSLCESREARQSMARAGQRLVDGTGAARVVRVLHS
jgi:UDP-2,4-diacetamido-2,4,6-trideoxy-beta-L-altropyranose hydrolase